MHVQFVCGLFCVTHNLGHLYTYIILRYFIIIWMSSIIVQMSTQPTILLVKYNNIFIRRVYIMVNQTFFWVATPKQNKIQTSKLEVQTVI